MIFLVAILHPALSVRWSVHPSVGPSVGPSHFTFSALMGFFALLLLPKCSIDLNYGPCPPARDWGSRVSGLVLVLFCLSKKYSILSMSNHIIPDRVELKTAFYHAHKRGKCVVAYINGRTDRPSLLEMQHEMRKAQMSYSS